jgi:hypothetical protein
MTEPVKVKAVPIFEVSNKVHRMLFSTRELADHYAAQFSPTSGIQVEAVSLLCPEEAETENTTLLRLERENTTLREALIDISIRGSGHEDNPTCMTCTGPFGNQYGPPRTGGWEGWAREIQQSVRAKAQAALDRVEAGT